MSEHQKEYGRAYLLSIDRLRQSGSQMNPGTTFEMAASLVGPQWMAELPFARANLIKGFSLLSLPLSLTLMTKRAPTSVTKLLNEMETIMVRIGQRIDPADLMRLQVGVADHISNLQERGIVPDRIMVRTVKNILALTDEQIANHTDLNTVISAFLDEFPSIEQEPEAKINWR